MTAFFLPFPFLAADEVDGALFGCDGFAFLPCVVANAGFLPFVPLADDVDATGCGLSDLGNFGAGKAVAELLARLFLVVIVVVVAVGGLEGPAVDLALARVLRSEPGVDDEVDALVDLDLDVGLGLGGDRC